MTVTAHWRRHQGIREEAPALISLTISVSLSYRRVLKPVKTLAIVVRVP